MIYTYCISYNDQIIYIGSTRHFKRRINRHHHNYKKCSFPLYRLMRSLSKNVKRDFVFHILETNQIEDLAKHSERYYIRLYRPIGNKQIPRI